MVRPVDFADAQWWLALGAWNPHLPLVIHAVGGVGLVLVGKRVAVACDLLDCAVTRDVPESAVLLVPRDGALAAEVGVEFALVEIELVGMVIESDDHVGIDARAVH